MATLGSLVVSLEANLAKFTGEMEKSAYIAEQNARRTQKAIDNITGSIKGLMAAAGVGLSIKELWGTFKEVTTAESNLLKMANRLNTTTEELSALGIMARKTGMDADAFNIAIERMQKNISNAELKVEAAAGAVDEFGEPLEKGAKTLDELGLRAEVLNRLPLPDKLKAIAMAMQENIAPADKSRIALELFGRAGGAMVIALKAGPEAMDEWVRKAERLGMVIGTDMAERASKAKEATGDLAAAWHSFAIELTDVAAPAITRVINLLTDLIIAARKAPPAMAIAAETAIDYAISQAAASQAAAGVGPGGEAAESFFGAAPIPKEAFKPPIRPGPKPEKGGGASLESAYNRLQAIIDNLNKDIQKLTAGNLAEIEAHLTKTLNDIAKLGAKGIETAEAEALAYRRATLEKKKVVEDFAIFQAEHSGNAYRKINAQAEDWLRKYKGIQGSAEAVERIRLRMIRDQQLADQNEMLGKTKSYVDILAATGPLITDQFRWRERSLDLEIKQSQIELERWLTQKNITGEMAEQYRSLSALASQSKRFHFEAEKLEKTGGVFGGIQAWALRRRQSAILGAGELGMGLMGDMEKHVSSFISKGLVGALRGEKIDFAQIGIGIAESLISRIVEWGISQLFSLISGAVMPMEIAGMTAGAELAMGGAAAASEMIAGATIAAYILSSAMAGGGGGGVGIGGLGSIVEFVGGEGMEGIVGGLASIAEFVSFHQGGIVYAHQGYSNLRHDEVPAILKTGERVLTREQNRAYEGRGGGNGRGGIIINVTHAPAYHYRPTEADYKRDARQIVKAINQEIGKYGQRMGNGQI